MDPDPERQPLLTLLPDVEGPRRRFRALSTAEVQEARQEVHWNRARVLLIFLFWGIMVMCISLVACMLLTASSCKTHAGTTMPPIPPVHMSFAPLISHARAANEMLEYYT